MYTQLQEQFNAVLSLISEPSLLSTWMDWGRHVVKTYFGPASRHDHHFRIPTHISCRLCMLLNTAAAVLLLTVAHILNVSNGALPCRGRSCKPKLILPTHLHVIIRPTEQNRPNECILVVLYRTTLKALKTKPIVSLCTLAADYYLLLLPLSCRTKLCSFSILKRRTRCLLSRFPINPAAHNWTKQARTVLSPPDHTKKQLGRDSSRREPDKLLYLLRLLHRVARLPTDYLVIVDKTSTEAHHHPPPPRKLHETRDRTHVTREIPHPLDRFSKFGPFGMFFGKISTRRAMFGTPTLSYGGVIELCRSVQGVWYIVSCHVTYECCLPTTCPPAGGGPSPPKQTLNRTEQHHHHLHHAKAVQRGQTTPTICSTPSQQQ
ncbi:unnamed protein product, partial [Ectocarpus sp. 8 AP-2014]